MCMHVCMRPFSRPYMLLPQSDPLPYMINHTGSSRRSSSCKMCRLTAYIGTPIVAADLVTRPNHSIIKQVRRLVCD